MNRRSFVSFLAALPLVGWGVAKASPVFKSDFYKFSWNESTDNMVFPPVIVDYENNIVGELRDGRWHYFSDNE